MSVKTLFAPLILWHNAIQRRAHVRAYILIPVLIQRQSARRVLNKEIQKTRFVLLDLGEFLDDRVGYKVGAAAARGENE